MGFYGMLQNPIKQATIPVGYVPAAYQLYVFRWPPQDISTGSGKVPRSDVPGNTSPTM